MKTKNGEKGKNGRTGTNAGEEERAGTQTRRETKKVKQKKDGVEKDERRRPMDEDIADTLRVVPLHGRLRLLADTLRVVVLDGRLHLLLVDTLRVVVLDGLHTSDFPDSSQNVSMLPLSFHNFHCSSFMNLSFSFSYCLIHSFEE